MISNEVISINEVSQNDKLKDLKTDGSTTINFRVFRCILKLSKNICGANLNVFRLIFVFCIPSTEALHGNSTQSQVHINNIMCRKFFEVDEETTAHWMACVFCYVIVCVGLQSGHISHQ